MIMDDPYNANMSLLGVEGLRIMFSTKGHFDLDRVARSHFDVD
jgi:hypothetical protein